MFKNPRRVFLLLIILTIVLVIVDLPESYPLKFNIGNLKIDTTIRAPKLELNVFGLHWKKDVNTHLGLDLSGGTHLALEADMQGIAAADRASALESARSVIERRVNMFGVSEPIVQSSRLSETYRIIVELPGVTDVAQAKSLLGQTAQLEFREFTSVKEATEAAFVIPTLETTKPVGLTGKDLKRATVEFSNQTGEPEVGLEFSSDGGTKFAEITSRLIGKKLAIFLDDAPVTWPKVNVVITDGKAVITGGFTADQAKTLALQLNAGALPVPVRVVEERTVGATLGKESVDKSLKAGFTGLVIVAIFMIAQYGRLGILADLALVVYGLLTYAIFRWVPITLTLPGIAGFILSIGMAVDSNILIFERYKEEKRMGKPWRIAMELGFGKAWDSIRDANFTTLITCAILFNPGNWQLLPNSGMVRGFAITLFIGVVASLFTGIVVTRTFIRVLYKEKT
jgi:preprotein translocase subunit SecD